MARTGPVDRFEKHVDPLIKILRSNGEDDGFIGVTMECATV